MSAKSSANGNWHLLWCVLVVALVLPGHPVASASSCQPLDREPSGEYHFVFPRVVGDFAWKVSQYDEDPTIGATAQFWTGGASMKIVIADFDIGGIPDGIESSVFQKRFDAMKSEISASPGYDRALLQGERSRTIGSGAIPVREAVYMLQSGQHRQTVFFYLGARYGKFIDVRMTFDPQFAINAMAMAERALESMGAIFCKERSTPVSREVRPGGPPAEPAHNEIRKSIDRLLAARSMQDAAREFPMITTFAMSQPVYVSITIDETNFQLSGDQEVDAFLTGYYIAGATKFDLDNRGARFDPLADVAPALRAALQGYRILTIERAWFAHPFMERIARIEADGGLDKWVRRGTQQ